MERIAVVGLGYVGLPVALAFARHFPQVIGFDIDRERVAQLRQGNDRTNETSPQELLGSRLEITSDAGRLADCTCFIVTVPTPIDGDRRPDLRPLISACTTIGKALKVGAVVCFESTVYPGVTEEVCGPVLAEVSGLRQGVDFALAYSPERINPGDRDHRFETIVKVVSGQDVETLERAAGLYGTVVAAGIHRAPSIKVAEAAKVIENTQRDLNIALMNELAVIFERMGIRTADVLDAAATKWNFLRFSPGLVGGHCIGVDPYYLTAKAETLGYHPEVILAGRRINDGMGMFVAQRLIKLLIQSDVPVRTAKAAVLGLTFKEDVPDLRNSRVPGIVAELRQFGMNPLVHDPLADAREAAREYDLALVGEERLGRLDAVILAVPHRQYLRDLDRWLARIKPGGVLIDVKSALSQAAVPEGLRYWSL